MAKSLVIVESPTKARTLSKFLGSDFKIESTYGHLRDLPKFRIGVDTQNGFLPTYVVPKDRKEKVKELKKAAEDVKRIVLASDPDREGEAIAWHTAMILGAKDKKGDGDLSMGKVPVERITFHEITESSVKNALEHPRTIDMKLVDAQQARRILDRLVGYKLSPLLWNKIRKGLSAGRVQSVAVRLVVEREREIKAFTPQEYWEIEVDLSKLTEESIFRTKLISIGEKKAEVSNKGSADEITSDLRSSNYKVVTVENKEVRKWPYPPFSTSTMQQAAGNRFGWSAKKTMQLAQQLYEEGLITYMRTDSFNLSKESIESTRSFITKTFGELYVPSEPKYYKTKSKVAQEAHEAVRPTNIQIDSRQVEENQGRDVGRLYELIRNRMLACQMREAIYDQTIVDVLAAGGKDSYTLRAVGTKMKFDGWKKIYGNGDEETGNGDNEVSIPALEVNEELKFIDILPSQHFTEPPARYTEASLIRALEEKGIGRPSTYAPTMGTIQERHYVEKEDKKLIPSELGFTVNDFLIANFPDVVDYGFTALMEDGLDSVANGEKEWEPLIADFYKPFEEKLNGVYKNVERVKVEVETTDEKCELCGSPMVVRIGKFGKFLACSTYPKCTFTKNLNRTVGIACPKCGGDVIIKRTRRGKTFYGCSNYPKCDFASWTKPKIDDKSVEVKNVESTPSP